MNKYSERMEYLLVPLECKSYVFVASRDKKSLQNGPEKNEVKLTLILTVYGLHETFFLFDMGYSSTTHCAKYWLII